MSAMSESGVTAANVREVLGIPLPSEDRNYRLTYNQIKELRRHYVEMNPLNAAKDAIYNYAEALSDDRGIDGDTNLVELITSIGGRFSNIYYDQARAEDGSLFVHREREFDIAMPMFGNPFRNRFTIAHELGHYLMHNPKENAYVMRLGSNRAEWEANWFAAGFLMPRTRFLEAAARYANDVMALAGEFMVSPQAIEVRLRELRG
jgi:Zn-dependent peptidase ImmA (M78 family)